MLINEVVAGGKYLMKNGDTAFVHTTENWGSYKVELEVVRGKRRGSYFNANLFGEVSAEQKEEFELVDIIFIPEIKKIKKIRNDVIETSEVMPSQWVSTAAIQAPISVLGYNYSLGQSDPATISRN